MLSASEKDRRDLFVGTGARIGSVEQNIEKDFWVCWTLDACLTGFNQVDLDSCSKVVHRSQRALD